MNFEKVNISSLSKEIISDILLRFRAEAPKLISKDISFSNELEVQKFIASKIDHTLLKPEAKEEEIILICEEALKYNFASVCVNPAFIKTAFEVLENSSVKVCTVIGFPLGASTTNSKKFEAEEAIQNGASELDMVMNIGKLRDKNYSYVFNDIFAITSLTRSNNLTSKVIIETCLLSDEEKIASCLIAKDAGADFVKTSTGFSKGGAKVDDVALMKFTVGDKVLVKASGGIRSREEALKMVAAGADRIGTSSGVKIILGEAGSSSY